ncbi:uncharacterized protein PRCAT00002134001 [Priceomyces carsonii]|uniref:uncharacterized protein n=1 Tax=Priceomyces carsonii TaxID=28549 RepID=UPI002ED7F79D|nr:unnamed protein product [Priceomyces carsonii]
MALSEVKVLKRKINELEDITNNDIYRTKKMKMKEMYYDGKQPQQQRSPSPSEISSSSPPKSRSKSVSFDLSNNTQYENSPLLTPKEEDDFDGDILNNEESSIELVENEKAIDVAKNPDYVALSSTLRLLKNSKHNILEDISKLSDLLKEHSQKSSKDELVDFVFKLMSNDLNLPKPHKIIKSPLIEWTKYHGGLVNVNRGLVQALEIDESLFKTLNVFCSKT